MEVAFQVNNQKFGISKHRSIQSDQTHKDKQSGQGDLHCFANQINSEKWFQSLFIFCFTHGGRSGRDRHMQLLPVTTKVVSLNLLMARYTRTLSDKVCQT